MPGNEVNKGGGNLRSLGILSLPEGQQQFATHRSELLYAAGALPAEYRELLADYLRSGTVILAIMEHTRDVIDNEFGVPGGSGIRSDGAYYWRGDASEYVRRYGVYLPERFVEHCRDSYWVARSLAQAEIKEIDQYLSQLWGMRIVRPKGSPELG